MADMEVPEGAVLLGSMKITVYVVKDADGLSALANHETELSPLLENMQKVMTNDEKRALFPHRKAACAEVANFFIGAYQPDRPMEVQSVEPVEPGRD